jgi:sugar (pentulose or hexulose) kinase
LSTNPTRADCALGLDFGTSGARASLIDAADAQLFEAAVTFPRNDWPSWLAALWQLLGAVPAELRVRLGAISLCGTSATSLLCDAAGQPLLPALLYNDGRAQAEAAQICGLPAAESPTSSLAKLLWFAQQPEFSRARHFLHQADWLSFQLHGVAGVSDYHNGLKLGYDVAGLRYPAWFDGRPLAALLPRVLVPGAAVAAIRPGLAQRFGLPDDCVVRAGTTDSIAAFFASGACLPGQAVTSLGSTLVLKLLSTQRVDDPRYGIYSHRCGDRWLAGGASNCGGAVLEGIFGRQRLIELSARIDPSRPSGLDYYPLPRPGERFPINDPELQPRLLPRPQDDVLYLQGLLESLAAIEARGYQLLMQLGATPVREVLTAGGGAANPAWTALRRSALGVPVRPTQQAEAAYGAALLAAHGERLLYCTAA